jgi:protein disulfide-isomerase
VVSRISFGSLLLLLFVCGSAVAQAPAVAWHSDLATAQQAAAQTNRLVLVHFWAPWCKPCLRMDQEVFSQPQVIEALNAQFVCVKVNADEHREMATHYGIKALPTEVVLAADGRLIAQLPSPPTAPQYMQQLSTIAAGYRQMVARGAGAVGNAAAIAGAAVSAERPASMSLAALAQPTQGDPVGAYSEQRYADYFQRRQADGVTPPTAAATPPAANVNPPIASAPPAVQQRVAPTAPTAPAATAPGAATAGAANVGATMPPAQPLVSQAELPAGSPPLAMEGYCPVQLKEHKRWVAGDKRWGAIHRGRTYLFIGPQEQQKFLASPDAFAPVMSGNDPVAALDGGQYVPGRREFGVFYEDRVFLFAGEESLQRFYQNPNRYAAEIVQARR